MSDRIHQWRARGRSDLPIEVDPEHAIGEAHARAIDEDHATEIQQDRAIDGERATEIHQDRPIEEDGTLRSNPGRPDRAQLLAQTVSTETGAT